MTGSQEWERPRDTALCTKEKCCFFFLDVSSLSSQVQQCVFKCVLWCFGAIKLSSCCLNEGCTVKMSNRSTGENNKRTFNVSLL